MSSVSLLNIKWEKTDSSASLVKEESNVIIRNLGVKKVLADNGDAIGVRMLKSQFFPDLPLTPLQSPPLMFGSTTAMFPPTRTTTKTTMMVLLM